MDSVPLGEFDKDLTRSHPTQPTRQRTIVLGTSSKEDFVATALTSGPSTLEPGSQEQLPSEPYASEPYASEPCPSEPYTQDHLVPEGFTPDQLSPSQYTPEQHTAQQYTPERYTPENYTLERYTPENHTPERYTPDNFTSDNYTSDSYTPEQSTRQTFPSEQCTQRLDSVRAIQRLSTGSPLTATDFSSPGVARKVTLPEVTEVTMPRPAPPPGSRGSSSRSAPSSFYHAARERRARRVRFYRNGDRFFKGMVYAVSAERFRSFEALLTSLTSSSLCDNRSMPNGVRTIFTLDGARRVAALEDLEDGQSYVCATSDIFRTLDYAKNEECDWRLASPRGSHSRGSHGSHSGLGSRAEPRDHHRSLSSQSQNKEAREGQATSVSPSRSATYSGSREQQRQQSSHVTPRLITVLKQGKRPRRAVRLLLNRKTAQNFEQVMEDITDAVKMDCGSVRKLFGLSGRPVLCLQDFFGEDTIFIACGKDKMSVDQLDLDHLEVRQVNAYRPFSATMRDRVTLRRVRGDRQRAQGTEGDSSRSASVTKSEDGDTDRSDVISTSSCTSPNKQSSSCSTLTHPQQQQQQQQQTQNSQKDPYKNNESDDIPKPITLTNKYEVGPKIGTGNFAVVLECREKKSKRKYALKIINKASCKGREKMIDNEVRILRYVNHPNIIRLIEDFSNKQRIFYIMELVKGGDLFDAIASSTKYTETDASGMLHNLVSALDYLHAMKIVHRDVKPENLLIQQHEDGTKSLKLGDFGLATEVKGQLYTVCGTPTYVAPEVIAESGYGVKIDVWSAGVIAYILLCGFPPFSSPTDDQEELFDLIMTVCYDFPYPYWEDISQSAKNLIRRMLELDPEKRLSASQVLQHKWVSGETTSEADLQKTVSSGLGTFFRRSPRNPTRNAGIQIIATTALDKVSRYFQGRGSPVDKVRGTES